MKIEKINIKEIVPYINNAKEHPQEQIDQIKASIKEFGFNDPLAIDEKNVLIEGHGRLLALEQLGYEDVEVIKLEHLSEIQKKQYILAHNKLTMNTGFDEDILRLELEAIQLEADIDITGFDMGELEGALGVGELEVEEDVAPEVDETKEPYSKLGDIWLLGRHRLMCGDSTKECEVSKLMEGDKADMCFTDPPYNVDIGNIKHPKFKSRSIKNDNMTSEEFEKFCNGYTKMIKKFVKWCVYIAGPPGKDGRIMFGVADNLLHCSTTIIWNKDRFILGRGKYHNKYEPIWFGWVESGNGFTGDRTLDNVWDIPRPIKSDLHPTMKPIEVVTRALEDNPGSKTVLDLFGGSGTTLMTCEKIGRKNYSMELDEKYADVIVKRYHNLDKEDIKLVRDGVTYEWGEVREFFD